MKKKNRCLATRNYQTATVVYRLASDESRDMISSAVTQLTSEKITINCHKIILLGK
ncbi:MAG: hypothetical protein ACYS67_05160 [Planctomycetota bacterium]